MNSSRNMQRQKKKRSKQITRAGGTPSYELKRQNTRQPGRRREKKIHNRNWTDEKNCPSEVHSLAMRRAVAIVRRTLPAPDSPNDEGDTSEKKGTANPTNDTADDLLRRRGHATTAVVGCRRRRRDERDLSRRHNRRGGDDGRDRVAGVVGRRDRRREPARRQADGRGRERRQRRLVTRVRLRRLGSAGRRSG